MAGYRVTVTGLANADMARALAARLDAAGAATAAGLSITVEPEPVEPEPGHPYRLIVEVSEDAALAALAAALVGETGFVDVEVPGSLVDEFTAELAAEPEPEPEAETETGEEGE